MKKYICLILILCMMTVTGCGAADEKSKSDSESFVFVCPIVDNVYWEECIEGIRKADEELGTNTSVIGPKSGDDFVEEMPEYMREAIDDEPDGILVYSGIEGLYSLINDAVRGGTPVISIDSDAPDTKRVAFVGTKPYTLGYDCGKYMAEMTGEKANIGYICTSKSAENEITVFNAFKDAISDYDMTVSVICEGGNELETSAEAMKAMLENCPEITAVFCTGGENVTGAAAALKELGREDLTLVGMEDTEENLQYVRDGVIDIIVAQSPYQMGYQGVYLLKKYIDNGELNDEIYETECSVITKDNVDSYIN